MLLYLYGTRPMGITYGRGYRDYTDDIKAFSNSYRTDDTTTIRSPLGEIVMLNEGALS
jgi:hypothetical protein